MNSKKYKLGYIEGTFDIIHMGHLHIIDIAREKCEKVVVGVLSDKLIKNAIYEAHERLKIVSALKNVDSAMLIVSDDIQKTWREIGFDAVFVGDYEEEQRLKGALAKTDAEIIKVDRIDVSTADLREKWGNRVEEG